MVYSYKKFYNLIGTSQFSPKENKKTSSCISNANYLGFKSCSLIIEVLKKIVTLINLRKKLLN